MDSAIQLYMEETEDMLQKAEECLIRLETEYSSDDVNELFRIAHTIKGSSHMVGYEDIGNVMHKIEDMLDCARNGTLMFDHNIVSLCFEGLDIVEKMLQVKKDQGTGEMINDLAYAASEIGRSVDALINAKKWKEEKNEVKQPAKGIVSTLLDKKPKGKNKYYVSFFIEEDAPMVSPVMIMILKSVEEIGSLVYSSITDSYFSEDTGDNNIKELDIILCTDVEEAELYTYFSLPYVERINIADLTRSKLEDNDHYFNNKDDKTYIVLLGVFKKLYNILFNQPEDFRVDENKLQVLKTLHGEAASAFEKIKNKNKIDTFVRDFDELFSHIVHMYDGQPDNDEKERSTLQAKMFGLIKRASDYIKGKHIFRVFKPEDNDFTDRLRKFAEMTDKSSTLAFLIDLSNLDTLDEDEVRALIEVKDQMKARNIGLGIIIEKPDARRLINIFDSLNTVEDFYLFRSETDAIMEMLYSQSSMQRIAGKANTLQNGCFSACSCVS